MGEPYFVKEGRGQMVVLSHALGCDLQMWDGVAALLARRFTVLRYDHCGHGGSGPIPGPCTMQSLAAEAASLILRHSDEAVHFVGLGLGGMVAQQLAVQHPELVSSIVVAHSACREDDTARGMWRARIETVLNRGMAEIAKGAMLRWFSTEYRADPQGAMRVAAIRAVFESTDPRSYAAICEALSMIDFRLSNPRIACPALVIAGARDEATSPATAQVIWNTISGAELAVLDAAQLSPVEAPGAFASLVVDFIDQL